MKNKIEMFIVELLDKISKRYCRMIGYTHMSTIKMGKKRYNKTFGHLKTK